MKLISFTTVKELNDLCKLDWIKKLLFFLEISVIKGSESQCPSIPYLEERGDNRDMRNSRGHFFLLSVIF